MLCDKHGGRGKYAALLQHYLTDSPVQVIRESLEESRYRWVENGRNVELRFEARGEHHLPIALASMTAKYLREIFMVGWNGFWTEQIPTLKPTAGYPGDAQRFKLDIAQRQKSLGIEDQAIWRCR